MDAGLLAPLESIWTEYPTTHALTSDQDHPTEKMGADHLYDDDVGRVALIVDYLVGHGKRILWVDVPCLHGFVCVVFHQHRRQSTFLQYLAREVDRSNPSRPFIAGSEFCAHCSREN